VTAVAVFRNPNTIPFYLTTDLLLNVLFAMKFGTLGGGGGKEKKRLASIEIKFFRRITLYILFGPRKG
jgi:hypothetical protein